MESSRPFAKGIAAGLSAYGKSFKVLRDLGLRKSYLLATALTSAFVFSGTWAIGLAVDGLTGIYRDWMGPMPEAPVEGGTWAQAQWWVAQASESLMQVLAYLGLFWLKVKMTKYLVIAFMGPLMAWVSERVEDGYTGRHRRTSISQILREFMRGVRSAMLLFVTEMGLGSLLFVLTLFVSFATGPFALVFSPLMLGLSFMFGAWFYGASVFDFVWERQGKGARAGLVASWHSRGKVLGVGIPFQLWMSVPIVSWFLAPIFAPVTCAAAAVIACAGDEIKAASSVGNVQHLEQ